MTMKLIVPKGEAMLRVLHQLHAVASQTTGPLIEFVNNPQQHSFLREMREDEQAFMTCDDNLLAGLFVLSHEVCCDSYAVCVHRTQTYGKRGGFREQGGAPHLFDMVRLLLMTRFDELLSDLCKPLIDAEVKVSFIAPQFWVVRKRATDHKRPYAVVPVTQQQFEDEYI